MMNTNKINNLEVILKENISMKYIIGIIKIFLLQYLLSFLYILTIYIFWNFTHLHFYGCFLSTCLYLMITCFIYSQINNKNLFCFCN